MFTTPTGIIYSGKRGTRISDPGLINGIMALLYPEPDITLNGLKTPPDFVYLGGSADASGLDPFAIGATAYGKSLAAKDMGSHPPSYNQGSCFFGSDLDDSVKFAGTYPQGYYEAPLNTDYDITTEDMWIDLLIKMDGSDSTNDWIFTKNDGAIPFEGYHVYTDNGVCKFRIWDTSGNIAVVDAPTIGGYSWAYLSGVVNRDEASASGMKFFANGVAGTGADPSSVGSLTNASKFQLGRWSVGGSTRLCRCHVALLAGYFRSNWLAAGAAGMNEAELIHKKRAAKIFGQLPYFAAGTALPEVL